LRIERNRKRSPIARPDDDRRAGGCDRDPPPAAHRKHDQCKAARHRADPPLRDVGGNEATHHQGKPQPPPRTKRPPRIHGRRPAGSPSRSARPAGSPLPMLPRAEVDPDAAWRSLPGWLPRFPTRTQPRPWCGELSRTNHTGSASKASSSTESARTRSCVGAQIASGRRSRTQRRSGPPRSGDQREAERSRVARLGEEGEPAADAGADDGDRCRAG